MSDDPTKKVDEPVRYDTMPGVTAILERINQLGEQIRGEIAKVEQKIDGLRDEMNTRFKEVDSQLRLINRKLDDLGKDVLDVRARTGVAEDRINDLERKAS